MIKSASLNLRPMVLSDFEQLFLMKSDQEDIRRSGFATPPDKSAFKNWFVENLASSKRIMLIAVKASQEAVGYLYIRFTGPHRESAEISYGVKANFRGQGYGAHINALALEYAAGHVPELKSMVSWVASDNLGSIRNFLAIGYAETPETKDVEFQLPRPHMKQMRKFIFDLSQIRSG